MVFVVAGVVLLAGVPLATLFPALPAGLELNPFNGTFVVFVVVLILSGCSRLLCALNGGSSTS
jgi:hypothetical protein